MRRYLSTAALGALLLPLAAAPALADKAAECLASPGCTVGRDLGAGVGESGQPLKVAELVFDDAPADSWAAGLACRDGWREFWLQEGSSDPSLILTLCNDGYGASGVGEDQLAVGDNWLIHSQHGGSAWRWSSELLYRLSPFELLEEKSSGFWTLGLNYTDNRWSWGDWSRGEVQWWAPACDADGNIPDPDAGPIDTEPFRYLAIPALDEGMLPADAQGSELGSCALTLSTSGPGYLVYDPAGKGASETAWMKVLLAEPETLLVTVRLDELQSGGDSWSSADHLQIWQGPSVDYFDHCIEPALTPRRWAVRLSDGTVFAADDDPRNPPELLSLENRPSDDGGTLVFLTLGLVESDGNLTVLLSRGDGQKRQRWLLATSDFSNRKPMTLGGRQRIGDPAAGCALVDGKLERKADSYPASVE